MGKRLSGKRVMVWRARAAGRAARGDDAASQREAHLASVLSPRAPFFPPSDVDAQAS